VAHLFEGYLSDAGTLLWQVTVRINRLQYLWKV